MPRVVARISLQIGGELHDQVGEPLRKLWQEVWSRPPQPLGSALLPKSLQIRLRCENSDGPYTHAKVVWTVRIVEGFRRKYGEGVMQLDIILLVGLAALAVWTEVDKLRRRRYRDNEPLLKHVLPIQAAQLRQRGD